VSQIIPPKPDPVHASITIGGKPMSIGVIILLSAIGGGLLTGGAILGIQGRGHDDAPQEVSVTVDDAAHEDAETAHALTDTEAVAAAYAHAWETGRLVDLLSARELACWTHSHDEGASSEASQCASISHMTGREVIRLACEGYEQDLQRRECLQHFAVR
jgi:hypothetical protein